MGVTTAVEGGSSRWEGERGGICVPVDVGVIMGWRGHSCPVLPTDVQWDLKFPSHRGDLCMRIGYTENVPVCTTLSALFLLSIPVPWEGMDTLGMYPCVLPRLKLSCHG